MANVRVFTSENKLCIRQKVGINVNLKNELETILKAAGLSLSKLSFTYKGDLVDLKNCTL